MGTTPRPVTFTIKNVGSFEYEWVTINLAAGLAFNVVLDVDLQDLPYALLPGASKDLSITYFPTQVGGNGQPADRSQAGVPHSRRHRRRMMAAAARGLVRFARPAAGGWRAALLVTAALLSPAAGEEAATPVEGTLQLAPAERVELAPGYSVTFVVCDDWSVVTPDYGARPSSVALTGAAPGSTLCGLREPEPITGRIGKYQIHLIRVVVRRPQR